MSGESGKLLFVKKEFCSGRAIGKKDIQFLQLIGSGSFGKVYKVLLLSDRKEYALKVLSKNQLSQLQLLGQFENEVDILKNCEHPNIITLFAVFEDEGYIFLLMELASEGNLFEKLKKVGRFDEESVRGFMRDIIAAIQYLHNRSPPIIHRDLKPENVLLCSHTLKIADFGWSNFNNELRNTFCGTPDYLAPEMILGTGHDESIDIWGLGILMYELLHG